MIEAIPAIKTKTIKKSYNVVILNPTNDLELSRRSSKTNLVTSSFAFSSLISAKVKDATGIIFSPFIFEAVALLYCSGIKT
jgi:hypothetical protein